MASALFLAAVKQVYRCGGPINEARCPAKLEVACSFSQATIQNPGFGTVDMGPFHTARGNQAVVSIRVQLYRSRSFSFSS